MTWLGCGHAVPLLNHSPVSPGAPQSPTCRVRCDAALALAGLRDEEGAPAGLPALLDFYRRSYFLPSADGSEPATPRSVAIADPSEYFVAQAVVTAGG